MQAVNMNSKRITGPEPEKDLDSKASMAQSEKAVQESIEQTHTGKDSKALSEAAKPSGAEAKDSKAASDATKPSEAHASKTATQVAEVVKDTERLSIEDKEADQEMTPSKKRNFEEISAQPDSFNTALDKEEKSPDSSKRLKIDSTPPKKEGLSEELVA